MGRIISLTVLLSLWSVCSHGEETKLAGQQKSATAADQRLDARAWEILVAGVNARKASKRSDAIAALGTIGPRPEVVRLLEAALNDRDWGVRQLAAETLGEMNARQSIPKLQQALEDAAPEVRFTAAQALWEMGERSGRSLFLKILAGNRSFTQGLVQSSLKGARTRMHKPLALALIGVNEGAGFFLGPFAYGIPVAAELAKDRTAADRALAATLLSTDKDPESVEHLEAALRDKSWIVRVAAAKALGASSHRESIAKLEPLLHDEKVAVRCMAAASIVRISRLGSRASSSSLQGNHGSERGESQQTTAAAEGRCPR